MERDVAQHPKEKIGTLHYIAKHVVLRECLMITYVIPGVLNKGAIGVSVCLIQFERSILVKLS